jgi:hypothetical protein
MFESLKHFVATLFERNHPEEKPVRNEMLVRNYAFKQNYQKWLEQKRETEVLKNLYTSFTLSKLGISGDLPIRSFITNNQSSVLIPFIEPIGKEVLPRLQDYFRDRIMRIGYNLYLSERQIIARAGYNERVDRHILRPHVPAFSIDDMHEQLYGNIQISINYVNDRPLFLELSAEPVNAPNYSAIYPFDELIEILFL